MSAPRLCDALAELFAAMRVESGRPVGPTADELLRQLAPLYHDDVRFTDPLQSTEGRDAFLEATGKLVKTARTLRVTIEDRAHHDGGFFLAWEMELATKVSPRMTIPGITHARVAGGLIVVHRDHWDLLGATMGAVPLAGTLYKRLVAQLG